jgi:flagellar motor switch protein FliN
VSAAADQALVELANSTSEAVAGVLTQFVADGVERGGAVTVPADADPLSGIPTPSVATNVSYVDGVTGGNVFVISFAGARKLAAAMMGMQPEEGDVAELSELELSAVGEAANQMMAAAAAATAAQLGEEVEISPPETRIFQTVSEASGVFDRTPHATIVSFTILGEACRLIQLVPNAFVVRMTRALAELSTDEGQSPAEPGFGVAPAALTPVPVRVWAELGRTRMQLGHAVGLGSGAVVELDRQADDPVDLFVNGRRFASGRLLLSDGQWAVQIELVHSDEHALAATAQGGDG